MKQAIAIVFAVALAVCAFAQQSTLPPDLRANIDKTVNEALARSGAPSASIAVVRDGKIAYVHAYGSARLEPVIAASPEMRYSIGSISKQFTAAALLMLAEEKKLSIDDKVGKWLPDLTRANDVTVRQILSMTSGYQDFWPQDYVMPMMMQPVTAQEIVNGWAKKPLDFEPGTKWQYSNTNYVIAGMIVEKVSGKPLLEFLRERIFTPLHMTSVYDTDHAALTPADPGRYLRYALGPLREAPKEGRGWMFAAGELAMTAHDLALWDISMIDQTILEPASYRAMETEQLANGIGTRYGLGVSLQNAGTHRVVMHSGEVSGFTAFNQVYPDDRVAIAVLTNLDATGASERIGSKIATLLFNTSDASRTKTFEQAKAVYDALQHGRIDRSLFTSNANSYFTEQAVRDFASSLGPLGKPEDFADSGQDYRGGMTRRRFTITYPKTTLRVTEFIMPDGKIEQYQIAAAE
ncbi:MAG TPA: serine hydrolase domain-containing protein [Vicinamibacterales bacterium]|jgi:CubicO group peptidase (beta-lactamase class C family)